MAQCMPLMATLFFMTGCGAVMEATEPTPVDLATFQPGMSHSDVIAKLGAPTTTIKQAAVPCDVYKLFTRGHDAAGRSAVVAGEVIADVATLGLAEIVFTPLAAGTKSTKHTVLACYGGDDVLVSMQDTGTPVSE